MTETAWTPRAETGLTYDEAYEAAVCGYRVRCDRLQEGAYVDYQFNGLRINFAGGSSSGFTARDEDIGSPWSIVPLASEVKRDSWGRPVDPSNKFAGQLKSPAELTSKWGKHG